MSLAVLREVRVVTKQDEKYGARIIIISRGIMS